MLRLKLDIMNDEAYNPRTEEPDNIGTLCLWHNRYKLGDDVKHGLSPREYLMGLIPENVFYGPKDMKLEQMEDIVKMHYLFLPVYGYDHGGMSVSTKPYGDIWDSGRLGFIYCEKDKSEPSDDKSRLDRLRIEVERYNLYLQDIAFCATTEIYDGDKLLMDVRSGTLLGFPEMYTLYDLMPLSHIHAFDEDFDKNKTSWLPPMTKWAKLKDYKKIARCELEEAAKDIEEINGDESFNSTKNMFKDCRVGTIEEFEEVLARKGVSLNNGDESFKHTRNMFKDGRVVPIEEFEEVLARKDVSLNKDVFGNIPTLPTHEEIKATLPELSLFHMIAAYFKSREARAISLANIVRLKNIALNFSHMELKANGYAYKGKTICKAVIIGYLCDTAPELYYERQNNVICLKDEFSIDDFCRRYIVTNELVNLVGCTELLED